MSRAHFKVLTSLAILLTLGLVSGPAKAGDLSWSGTYRVEGLWLDNAELNAMKRNKTYALHHLVLSPKIVAADGINIYARFDILNNTDFGANSQLGQFWGDGVGTTGGASTTARDSNVLSQNLQSELFAVSNLYATWTQEFGQLIVGRVPMNFGLGISHNAGLGEFDHWYDTRDAIGYKVIFGNISFMPMIGKSSEGLLGYEDDVNNYIAQLMYENPETDLAIGISAEWRSAALAGNDAPAGSSVAGDQFGGTGATVVSKYKDRLLNLFVKEKVGGVELGVEGAMWDGKTGVRTATGTDVNINAYAIALELEYAAQNSKWTWGLKTGVASGDDPGTPDKYESFVFDRNYDVGFLMFNHPLGQADFMRSGVYANTAVTNANTASELPDTESISNAFYLSPRFNQKINDKVSWGGLLTWATLQEEAFSGMDTDLGYELDLNLTYKPYERMTLVGETGLLFPGDAWKGGPTENFDSNFAWGISTKAAISF